MRRPQSPETVYLKTLLVMLVFLKVSKEVLGCPKCELKEVSTSNITIKGNSSCTVGDNYQSTPKDNDLLVSNLNPGTSYNLTVNCSTECCNLQVTTRPDVIRNLSVTEITTSSVSLNWTEPQGKSSVYRVVWDGSTVAMNETSQTSMNITGLTAGVQYMFRVFAVAGDNQTAGNSVNKTQYTRPDVIRNLSVTEITTSSVSLNWTEPQGKSSVYRVAWNHSSVAMHKTTSQTSMNIPGLTAGAQYMFRVFAVAGDNQTAGDSVNKTQYTRPDVIRNLSVTEITTSSVSLNWTEPQGKSSVYRVVWNDSSVAMHKTTSQTSMNIPGLTAGAQYMFRVFAVAGDNQTAGDSVNKTQYTKPNMPSNVKAVGSTTNMNVTWRSSSGDDSNYTVEICNSSRVLIDKRTVSSIQPVVFSNLRPGHLYIVKVIIHSGPFNASSNITNATYPNPPEAIRVEEQTTISLKISWGRPLDMDPGQYNFTVFRSDHQPMTLADNWALVENLTSGTQYNISVATVGPWGYQSVPVQISATTRPQPVNNLRGEEITTSGITLIWEQPEPKEHYTYHVRVAGPNGTQRNQTVSSTSERIEKLQSGYNHTFTVTTLTADGTTASPQSISLFTRPFPVTGLNAVTQNTSTVYLSWNKPLGYQHYYTYRVETTQCPSAPKNQSERNESAYVTDLRSGSNCSFTVFSQVGNEIEGEAVSISQYTKPEKLAPSVSSHTNDSITVTWDSPSGTVEKYVVNLASRDGENSTKELNSSNRSYKFARLMAGKIYTVKLKTVSGPFTEESEPVSNATYPNQPGPIILKEKTTNSIAVEWGEAPGMVKGSFNYTVFYQPSTNLIITQKNTINLIGLLPGIAYNISVTSLGPLTLSSLPVHIQQVTRPKKVSNLKVNSTSVDEVTLQWSSSRFRYRVETAKDSYETNLTRYQVRNLTPGTEYTFSVITLAFDGTEGGPRSVEVCTDAAPVTDLSCRGPNLTQAVLMLSWTKPRGANQGFQVNSNNNSVERKCQDSCSHNLTGLLYNKAYTVKIWTLGCQKKKSAITEIPCKTGITVPPVPDTADVSISGKEYNRFTLQLKPNLFNDTNGPIESYGVLVTSQLQSLSGENKSSLQNYLTKTYEDWTVERTTTYLALIKDMGSRNRNGDDGRVVVVGDGTKSHSYNNGPLSALGTYSFAVVTFTNLELNNGIVSVGKSFFSISEFSHEEIFLPVNPVVVGGAAGGTLAVLLILIIATVIAAIWLKRLSKKQSSEVPLYSIRAKVSSPVKVENYEAYFRQHQADSNCGFAEQFENLKTVGVAQAKSSAIMLENKGKNRYNNVLPCEYAQNLWFYRTTQNLHSFKLSVGNQTDDSSRVKLSAGGSAYDDYINANYMPGYNSRKEFIAAQGPLPSTVNDFWRMIWEKNVHTLVMLTRCNEQGRVKCEKYWPSGAGHYNNITVTTTSEIPLEDWTIRDFSVKNVRTAETRTVSHFHFTAWPDHGVPETTELLINFRHLVREHMDQYSRHFPTVVHCSAGVGRTGTFIAIDRLIFQIERDSVVDVYGVVHDLRMHRPLMVQTEDQLVFLNQCALDIIRSRTGTNVDLIYQNTAALSIYENFEPMKNSQNGCNT